MATTTSVPSSSLGSGQVVNSAIRALFQRDLLTDEFNVGAVIRDVETYVANPATSPEHVLRELLESSVPALEFVLSSKLLFDRNSLASLDAEPHVVHSRR